MIHQTQLMILEQPILKDWVIWNSEQTGANIHVSWVQEMMMGRIKEEESTFLKLMIIKSLFISGNTLAACSGVTPNWELCHQSSCFECSSGHKIQNGECKLSLRESLLPTTWWCQRCFRYWYMTCLALKHVKNAQVLPRSSCSSWDTR